MNLHPIFVHFPVAFLSFYALLEFLRFKKLLAQPYWFYVKAVLVFLGSIMTPITLITGAMAEDIVVKTERTRMIVEKHEFFAVTTTVIFWIVSILYALVWYAKYKSEKGVILEAKLVKFAEWILNNWPIVLLALLGLIAVTITGGLGGAIAFGPKADPFFEPVFHLITGQ